MYNIFDVSIEKNNYKVKIVKRKNCKKITLRVNIKTKQPVMSIPFRVTYEEALSFLKNNYTWVNKQLAKIASHNQEYSLSNLPEIFIYGEPYSIIKKTSKKNNITLNKAKKEVIIECKDITKETLIEKNFVKFLKKVAKIYFNELSKYKAQLINTCFTEVNVSDTTSKWGSCSLSKKLQYNYRLIMAPIFVIDYVISHEVAHLVEFNHKENFWRIVNQLTPYTNIAKIWLKENGRSLY